MAIFYLFFFEENISESAAVGVKEIVAFGSRPDLFHVIQHIRVHKTCNARDHISLCVCRHDIEIVLQLFLDIRPVRRFSDEARRASKDRSSAYEVDCHTNMEPPSGLTNPLEPIL